MFDIKSDKPFVDCLVCNKKVYFRVGHLKELTSNFKDIENFDAIFKCKECINKELKIKETEDLEEEQ